MRTGLAALLALAVVATAAAARSGAPPYTLRATNACLLGLPRSVAGLPPAAPPVPALRFVYAQSGRRQIGVWDGTGTYRGVILHFFRSAAAARASFSRLTSVYGGTLSRNVVAEWDAKPGRALRAAVEGCLRSRAAPATARSVPPATLATFAGGWGGHTRRLSIDAAGRGVESVNDGCCIRAYDLTFRVLSVRGTLTRATAAFRVLSFRRHDNAVKRLHVGEVGRLTLRNGIVTNALTGVYYCSDPAWGATGACGA